MLSLMMNLHFLTASAQQARANFPVDFQEDKLVKNLIVRLMEDPYEKNLTERES